MNYGKELILDLHECNPEKFTRYFINKFFKTLCLEIDMKACRIAWWDYTKYPEEYKKAPAHLKGTSAVQFISTSNITIHTLDEMKRVYLNVFSCKSFPSHMAAVYAEIYFEGKIINEQVIDRI